MKMKLLSVVCAMSMLGACATTSAPEVTSFQGQRLQISSTITPAMFDAGVELYINGDKVIDQRSQPFGGSSQSFEGNWRGQHVMARATRVQNLFSAYTQVDVFIQGQLVETLTV